MTTLNITTNEIASLTDERLEEFYLLLHTASDDINRGEESGNFLITIDGTPIYARANHAAVISAAMWLATQPNAANAAKLRKELKNA